MGMSQDTRLTRLEQEMKPSSLPRVRIGFQHLGPDQRYQRVELNGHVYEREPGEAVSRLCGRAIAAEGVEDDRLIWVCFGKPHPEDA
jgi:hypothetical protein